MNGTIQKWGNSQAIRLPKNILEQAYLRENDTVEIIAEENKIIILKKSIRKHIPLKERLKNYDGDFKAKEWDTGEPVGNEVF